MQAYAGSCSNDRYVGLCIGLLAAATVSSSHSLANLLTIAVEVVCISLKFGLAVRHRSQMIERKQDEKDLWAILITKISADEARNVIDEFHNSKVFVGFEASGDAKLLGNTFLCLI